MNKECIRNNSYDLLRIICSIGVIFIHVSSIYLNNAATNHNTIETFNIAIASFFNCIGRFAVPCFFMLSGALLLGNENNKNYKNFYIKALKKIVIPTIVFSIFYFILRVILQMINGTTPSLFSMIKRALCGDVYYHLWYMYVLIGIYALIPIVMLFKDSINKKTFYIVSVVFFTISVICLHVESFKITWNFGRSFLYLSYVMIGYTISDCFKKKKVLAFIFFTLSCIVLLMMSYLVFEFSNNGILSNELTYPIQGGNSILSALYGICMFIAFNSLILKIKCEKMSQLTFYIYLVHAFVWDIMTLAINKILSESFIFETNYSISIISFSLIVFIVSIIISVIIKKIIKYATMSKIKTKPLAILKH